MRRVVDYLRRHHLGLIAIFIAFSGTAYANGLIGSNQIRSGAIQSRHIANSQVKGEDIANDTITGAKIDEATLDIASSDPNAQTLDGLDSTDFLRSNGTATNSARLGGDLPSAFLGANAKAADANLLDGLNSTDFLGSNAKAADADFLDGLNSTAFLGASAKAADSNTLDGIDSTAFVQGGPAEFTDAGVRDTTADQGCPDGYTGWVDGTYGGVQQPVSVWRDPFGIVHLSGFARECGVVASSTVLTLPAGYRPSSQRLFPMVIKGGGYTDATFRSGVISSDGALTLNPYQQSAEINESVWLEGVTFRCGPAGVAGCP